MARLSFMQHTVDVIWP